MLSLNLSLNLPLTLAGFFSILLLLRFHWRVCPIQSLREFE